MISVHSLLRYVTNLLACVSQFLNVLLFNGHPNETISARCGREVSAGNREGGWAKLGRVIDLLFSPIEEEHCFNSYLTERMWARELLKEKYVCRL